MKYLNFRAKKNVSISIFSGELLSNDPPTKENPYKSFFSPIGSARPIRGLNYRTPILKIHMDWDLVKVESEK